MDDETAAVEAAISQAAGDAAAAGIRRAYDAAVEAGGNDAVGEGPVFRIGGVLSAVDGQRAAADGAAGGVAAIARLVDPQATSGRSQRTLREDITRSQAGAAAGAITALRSLCLMEAAARGAPAAAAGEIQVFNIDLERAICAVRVGVRAGFLAARLEDTSGQPSSSRCVALLLPLLGGSLPATVAVYNIMSSSEFSPTFRRVVFCVLMVGVFAVCSGVLVGTFSSSWWRDIYCMLATGVAFAILGALIIAAFYSLFV